MRNKPTCTGSGCTRLMRNKPTTCKECPLEKISRGFLPPSPGKGKTGLMILGNHPDSDDVTKEENFYPHTMGGGVLKGLFTRAGLDKEDFALGNMIACTPPKNIFNGTAWAETATEHCTIHREAVLRRYSPNTILALGDAALKHATGFSGKKSCVDTMRGYAVPSSQWVFDNKTGKVVSKSAMPLQQYVDGDYTNVPVIPTHDPRILRMGKSKYNNVLLIDILRAKALSDKIEAAENKYEWFDPSTLDYINCKSVEQLKAFRDQVLAQPERLLSYDIETNTSANDLEDEIYTGNTGSKIESVQFSLGVGLFLINLVQPLPVQLTDELSQQSF